MFISPYRKSSIPTVQKVSFGSNREIFNKWARELTPDLHSLEDPPAMGRRLDVLSFATNVYGGGAKSSSTKPSEGGTKFDEYLTKNHPGVTKPGHRVLRMWVAQEREVEKNPRFQPDRPSTPDAVTEWASRKRPEGKEVDSSEKSWKRFTNSNPQHKQTTYQRFKECMADRTTLTRRSASPQAGPSDSYRNRK